MKDMTPGTLPDNVDPQLLQEVMAKLTEEMHRLEKNIQTIQSIQEKRDTEGGTDNGSH